MLLRGIIQDCGKIGFCELKAIKTTKEESSPSSFVFDVFMVVFFTGLSMR